MGKYDKIKIQHICSNICSGGTPKSTVTEYYGGNIPWLNTKEINFCRIYETERTITDEGLNNSSAKWVPANTVIVAMYGATAGKTAIAKIPLTTNQACCNLNIDSTKADYRFVYYALYNDYAYLASLANGGAQQNLNAQQIKEFEIPFPSLKEQKRIADILSSLDDKIELNRRINRNLEQQAQALFKAWFVDFEPFKNGKFVDSELGRIPEGWKIGLLNELIELQSGFAFKSDTFVEEGEYRLITIKAVQDGYLDISGASYINEVPTKMPHYCFLQIGDMLLSLTGNVGRVCIVSYNNLLLNQRVAKIKPIKEMDRMFTYTLFRRNEFKNRLIYLAKGTAQLNLSPIETIKQKVIIPPRHILNRYGTIANIMYDSIIEKMQESIALTNLRDTLLPRLMSGELNVNTITE